MAASKNGGTPQTSEVGSDYRFPASRKVYTAGQIHPSVRVPHREIALHDTHNHLTGEIEANMPLRVYDTSGPYTDPQATIDVRQGLAPLRGEWIRARGAYTEAEPS